MSTKPRNPRYFPRMKVRGAARKHQAPFQKLAGSFDRLGIAGAGMTAHLNRFIDAITRGQEQ